MADPVLLGSVDVARDALGAMTPSGTIGAEAGSTVEGEHALTLLFECLLPGYRGWVWAATLFRVDEESPVTVAETTLLPGERALLAPDWVPWSERLSEYQAAQEGEHADGEEDDSEAADLGDDDEDDLLDDDIEIEGDDEGDEAR